MAGTVVADPAAAQDAATRAYVDARDGLRVAKAGDSMTGVLNMGANKVTNVANPTVAQPQRPTSTPRMASGSPRWATR